MGEVFFVIKGFALTILLTVLLQIKVGQETLEQKAERFANRSQLNTFVNDAAAGAVKAIRDGHRWIKQEFADSSVQRSRTISVGPAKIQTREE